MSMHPVRLVYYKGLGVVQNKVYPDAHQGLAR